MVSVVSVFSVVSVVDSTSFWGLSSGSWLIVMVKGSPRATGSVVGAELLNGVGVVDGHAASAFGRKGSHTRQSGCEPSWSPGLGLKPMNVPSPGPPTPSRGELI